MADAIAADTTRGDGRFDVLTEDVWIEMPDGCRLFGILRRPDVNEAVPSIVTATPYGVKVGGNTEEQPILSYLSGLGYGTLQVDLRGSRDSQGVPEPEYSEQEQDDLVEVIAWLGAQQWCNARVGMRGMSWSGVNTLQVAARRPPELKAIISGCAMDDIYGDGDFFLGGCQMAWDHIWWGTLALMVQAQPPSPETHGDRWVDLWRERLRQIHAPVSEWLEHQRRDAFWLDRSVCKDYSAIDIPALLFSGYLDGYPGSVYRLVEKVEQAWGIVGPWSHLYPYQGRPGPSISAAFETRWWERWLKEVENGVDGEPRMRLFVRDPRPLHPAPAIEPGKWVGIQRSPSGEPYKLQLEPSQLSMPADGDRLSFSSPQNTGVDAPPWCINFVPAEYDQPPDQRAEDGRSLCYTTAPLRQSLDIAGAPALTLTLSADQPVAKLAVRLCHVMADGSSRLLAVGALNLTHRHGSVSPEPVVPGEPVRVRVELRVVGNRIPAGDRLRIALSPNYWPWIWPAPTPVTLTLHLDEPTELELPIVPADATEVSFEPGESFLAVEPAQEGGRRITTTDLGTGETIRDEPAVFSKFSITETDPTSATIRVAFRSRRVGPYTLDVSSLTTVDESTFVYEAQVLAWSGDELIADRTFKSRHARDFQ